MYVYRNYLIDRPSWQGIKQLKRGYPKKEYKDFGFDTEFIPSSGEVTVLSFANESESWSIVPKKGENLLDLFIGWIDQLPDRSIVWAHNLEVDLVALVATESDRDRAGWYSGKEVQLSIPSWRAELKLIFGSPCFGEIRFPYLDGKGKRRNRKTVYLRDSYAFIGSGLEKISQQLFGEGKDDIPFGAYGIDWRVTPVAHFCDLGTREGSIVFRKQFTDYAEKDTELVRRVGGWIHNRFKSADVRLPVSLPHYSASVFRRSLDAEIEPLPPEVFEYGLRSYFGGRVQTFYKGMFPLEVRKYDINSAYAAAIQNLPDLRFGQWTRSRNLDGEWSVCYAHIEILESSLPVTIRSLGYRLAFPVGRAWGYWTGEELRTAERLGFVRVLDVNAYVWETESRESPFRDFVVRNWEEKQKHTPGEILYTFPKLSVNSLYGKFLNLRKTGREVQTKGGVRAVYTPGSMFNPVIASWITASCRSRILEAQAHLGEKLINIQTDGLWTCGEMDESDDLGAFSLEAEADELLTIRGNVYMPFKDGSPLQGNTKLHAYQGRREAFLEALKEGTYMAERWVRRFQASREGSLANRTVAKRMAFNWNRLDYKMHFADIKDVDELLGDYRKGSPYSIVGGALHSPN